MHRQVERGRGEVFQNPLLTVRTIKAMIIKFGILDITLKGTYKAAETFCLWLCLHLS